MGQTSQNTGTAPIGEQQMMPLVIGTNASNKWLQINTMAWALPKSSHDATVPEQEDNQAASKKQQKPPTRAHG